VKPSAQVRGLGCVGLLAIAAPVFFAQGYKPNLPADHPAIQYPTAPVSDVVAQFAQELECGTVTLRRDDALGYLPDVLAQLGINHDSQLLVFSKTSFQASHISPQNPRAIYFNDNVAVGYVPGGASLELSAVDRTRGPVFYAMFVDGSGKPTIARGEGCLSCHQGPNTAGVPGIYVGSVIPGPTGAPLRDDTAIITDHRSAFKERWGGWYVTARRGQQPDRANAFALDPADPAALERESRQNLPSLAGLFDLSRYVTGTSDIVALMTFEHQTQMTNLITRVAWQGRIDAHPAPSHDRATATGNADIEELVSYMLFSGEAPLAEPIEGVSSFARTFPQRGPRDGQGRSLRDFDLRTRLFRYPLSYMIHSAAFDALSDGVRDRVLRRLHEILSGVDKGPAYAHLSLHDRRAIIEILRDTRPDLPSYWRVHD
jgi:hypothetical protein